MFISKIKIHNFKCFKDFEMGFTNNVNVIVGNNNEGKTTILEAIHLALTATFGGKNVIADIPSYIFNKEITDNYLSEIKAGKSVTLPKAFIELYFSDKVGNAYYIGNNNTKTEKTAGVKLVFELNPDCVEDYNAYIAHKEEVKTIPIEYYQCAWYTFAENGVVRLSMPVRSNYIDISTGKYISGPDKQVLQIVEDVLSPKERTDLTIAYRKLREAFQAEPNIEELNKKVASKYQDISNSTLSLDIEVASKTSWQTNFTTFFNDVPFHQIGKGEQSSFKIKLALSSQKDKCNVVLIEEPENHLSHSNMAKLIDDIVLMSTDTQVIISTHSTFVLNKLNLDRVILLQNQKSISLTDLPKDTVKYFEKMPGYDTLRLILSKKVFLVEGPSDELIIQKLYKQKHSRLPLEDRVDIISVRGTSFARFLDIAKNLETSVVVITDNDKKSEKKIDRFSSYTKDNQSITVAIIKDNELFTLEKVLIKLNGREKINRILGKSFTTDDELFEYMSENKADCALKVFMSDELIDYADEVKNAI